MRKSPLLLAILSALPGCSETFEDTACMEVPEEQLQCAGPDAVDRSKLFLLDKCGDLEITEVLGPGTRGVSQAQAGEFESCCYPVKVVNHDPGSECVIGRPYFEDGKALSAPLVTTSERRERRGAAWAEAGAAEHASVAAFARLALQLMRHGAPTALLGAVHQAAVDEVRHTELCWSLAEKFGAERVAPGKFPFGAPVTTDISLASLAAEALRDGCLAETLGAHVADVAARLAPEPAVRDALRSIADEEATHAVLSFRIVAWALAAGGAEVKAAVLGALSAPWPRLDVAELALRAGVAPAVLQAAAAAGVAEVLEPAVARLLAA